MIILDCLQYLIFCHCMKIKLIYEEIVYALSVKNSFTIIYSWTVMNNNLLNFTITTLEII